MHVWFKGKCVPQEEASVPVTDRGFLFGEGIFRTLKITNGVIELYHTHLQRFETDCKILNIQPDQVDPQAIRELLVKNQAQTGVWRLKWIATPTLGLLMTLEKYNPPAISFKLKYYSDPIQGPSSQIKSLSYLDRQLLAKYAAKYGVEDVITSSAKGCVTETSMANLFWKEGNKVYFPDPVLPFLEGVTVKAVQHTCDLQGLVVQFVQVRSIPFHASVYLCNSMRGIVPIERIDDLSYPLDPPFINKLVCAFKEYVEPFHFKYG